MLLGDTFDDVTGHSDVNRGSRFPRRLVELSLDRGGQPRPAVEIAVVEGGADEDELQPTVR